MKKLFLFSMIMAATVSSCTKENVIDYTEPSEVKIKFGADADIVSGVEVAQSKASRASIDKWDNTNVGVFLLSKDDDADWANQGVRDVLWNNVSATISEDKSANVTLGGQTAYYPNQGDRSFSFFGYHPYSSEDVSVTETVVTKQFRITGQEDILWGKAEVAGNGYNAKYFRTNPDAMPDISFGHMLTKLQFNVKATDSFEEGQTFKVTGIKLIEVPRDLTLTVADRTGTSGIITPGTKDQEISAYENATGIEIKKGTTATAAGLPVMIYTDTQYKIKVYMTTPDGNTVESEPTEITANGKPFQQGYAYDVTLGLNSYKKIEFQASLVDWKTGDPIYVEF